MLEDSEFEQGLEMLTVALAYIYIILLRIAGAPCTHISPAGILSILWVQHVSCLGSSCRSS